MHQSEDLGFSGVGDLSGMCVPELLTPREAETLLEDRGICFHSVGHSRQDTEVILCDPMMGRLSLPPEISGPLQ